MAEVLFQGRDRVLRWYSFGEYMVLRSLVAFVLYARSLSMKPRC
jgi:hypothetical protein